MASAEPCNCDETQQLRAEVARLTGVIQGMREGLELLRAPQPAEPKPSRCSSSSIGEWYTISCELPAGHAGGHRFRQIVWPQ